jgi:hypothetical protein
VDIRRGRTSRTVLVEAHGVRDTREFAFVHVVEPGRLEHQSLLLSESLRRFAGEFKDCAIYAIQPSRTGRISEGTRSAYRRLGVSFHDEVLNTVWADYPYLNTSYAAAYVESVARGRFEFLVLLDTDTLFLSAPSGVVLSEGEKIGIRPIDSVRRQIAFGPRDAVPEYWREIYAACGVDPGRLWTVRTTEEDAEVVAYFNNGVVVSRVENQFFSKCIAAMERARSVPYFRHLSQDSLEWHFLDQAFASALILREFGKPEVRILGPECNYPFSPILLPEEREHGFSNISILHYHSLFEDRSALPRFASRPELYQFLDGFLPLRSSPERRFFHRVVDMVPGRIRRRLATSRLYPLIRRVARLFDVRVV